MSITGRKSKNFLLFILFMQFTFDIVVLLDISVMRQVIGFIYLTFVPGFIIVKLLKLDELEGLNRSIDRLEIVLFSAGFGVAFLMIAGVLANELLFLFGVSQPLSIVVLMIVLNSFTFAGGVLVYLRSENVKILGGEPIKMSLFSLLFLSLPILSIVGAMYVNAYQNNLLLLFMIIAISLLFVVGVMSKKLLPSRLYPLALLTIAIAILYHSSLISNYIVPFASDVPIEYFLFNNVQFNAHWSSTLPPLFNIDYSSINAMLSIVILPTVYSTILKIDPTWTFKLIFPLIFALLPLGLYQVWQTFIDKKYAFISAFLFMALEVFFTEMFGLNRQMIAELFLVLLLLVIRHEKMKPVNKMICFMIFSFALITSHYALSLIFLFFLSFTSVLLIVLKRPSKNITFPMVVFFFAVMFVWYIYTSGSGTFEAFLTFGERVHLQLGNFLKLSSRGETVLTGLGLSESPSICNTVSRIFAYLTEAFILVGIIGSISKRGRIRIGHEYFILSLTATALLVLLILVPGLASTLNMSRFYHILLIFLAPFFVIGVGFIIRLLSKREKEVAVLALSLFVLVPYFLFQTEFMFEITESDSWSIPLSGYRMNVIRLYGKFGYTHANSVYGAQWLSGHVMAGNLSLYADISNTINVLTIYGMIYQDYVNVLSNTTVVENGGTVYLSRLNVVYNTIAASEHASSWWNSSDLARAHLRDLSQIYSNGEAVILRENR